MRSVLSTLFFLSLSAITYSQNVGIGTTTPGEKLTVAGTIESTTGGVKFPDASIQAFSGKVINVTYRVNNTRTVLASAASTVMESFTVNKKSATSLLIIQGTICGYGPFSGMLQQGWKLGAGTEVLAQSVMYDENNFGKVMPTSAVIAGHTTTGSQTLVFRYYSNMGSAERPFLIYNPSNLDDPRSGQTSSVYIVWEVEPN